MLWDLNLQAIDAWINEVAKMYVTAVLQGRSGWRQPQLLNYCGGVTSHSPQQIDWQRDLMMEVLRHTLCLTDYDLIDELQWRNVNSVLPYVSEEDIRER